MMTSFQLIADSGSTKTDWAMRSADGSITFVKTQGINPFHQDEETIRTILQEVRSQFIVHNSQFTVHSSQLSLHPSPSTLLIEFYGSGVRPELSAKITSLLQEAFPQAIEVHAHSDLLGAARALCGHNEGIACILGTGANSCLYDGTRIVQNTPALGYILGDEGSGAVLGSALLNALYKGMLPDALRREFEDTQNLTIADIIARVYRQPMPNRFLASLSPFIHDRLHIPVMHELVVEQFRRFFVRNLSPYARHDLPVSAVGSIAFYYESQLREAAQLEGYTLGRIECSPLQALVAYHQ